MYNTVIYGKSIKNISIIFTAILELEMEELIRQKKKMKIPGFRSSSKK
jgi:hypothetical protein